MSSSKTSNQAVRRVSTTEDFLSLKEEWNALAEKIPHLSLFLTWEWNYTWWCHHNQEDELWIITVRDSEGRLVGIAPWRLVFQQWGLFHLRQISFIHHRPAVHQNVIALEEDQTQVCEAILSFLTKESHTWDLFDLQGVVNGSRLQDRFKEGFRDYHQRSWIICPYISLPEDWNTFQNEALSANRRKQIRKNQRRLERDYPSMVSFKRICDPEELSRSMEVLIKIHQKRWHERHLSSTFDDPRYADFNHDFAQLALERGWLRFYQLSVAEEIIALRYCFSYGGKYFDYLTTFDPNWSQYSPGELLLAYVIQDAISEGAYEFDMLRGNYRWKNSWGSGSREEAHFLLGSNLPSRTRLMVAALFDMAQTSSRKILPDEIREKINYSLSLLQNGSLPIGGVRSKQPVNKDQEVVLEQ